METDQLPTQPPYIYLRGAGVGAQTWGRVERAMWMQGWRTVSDRTQAWHLARAGVEVVRCDFSSGITYFADSAYTTDGVIVGRMQARYVDVTDDDPTVEPMDLSLINGGTYEKPTRRDAETINNLGVAGAFVIDEAALVQLITKVLR